MNITMAQNNPFDSKRGKALKVESGADLIAVFIATGFGAGFIPFGPGTWGSIVGLLIAYGLIAAFGSDALLLQNVLIAAGLVSAALGVWASDRAEKIFDRKDASQIVVDEVFGQIISFVFIAPYLAGLGASWRWWMIAGFALFRAFDIFKPYPINRLQGLPGGLGVMMDDALAGVYAAVALSLLWMLI
ncbi:MAG TPA: phosphatidylglycerophosphatase A [Blastocatellia bacterium]|nr:phosphatidylglycerophosphatase A [Blastocatellia bacterium]